MNSELPFKHVNYDRKKYGPCLTGKVLILEGLISAGKSTAGKEIQKYAEGLNIKCKFFPEPLIDDLLQLFLADQKKYAFSFQLAMLVKRQAIYREAFQLASKGYFCIIDRSLYGDYCFATMHKSRGNISENPACLDKSSNSEWKTYLSVLHSEEFERPDYVLYLDVSVETAIKRCKQRDRNGETKYDPNYFEELRGIYNSIIPTSSSKLVETVDWNDDRDTKNIAVDLLNKVKKMYESSFSH